jgi:hypothetical protein
MVVSYRFCTKKFAWNIELGGVVVPMAMPEMLNDE